MCIRDRLETRKGKKPPFLRELLVSTRTPAEKFKADGLGQAELDKLNMMMLYSVTPEKLFHVYSQLPYDASERGLYVPVSYTHLDHPEAAKWRGEFIRLFSRQLDVHCYQSGVWEESHTYFQHVLLTLSLIHISGMPMCRACFPCCICLSFSLLRIFTSTVSRLCFFQRLNSNVIFTCPARCRPMSTLECGDSSPLSNRTCSCNNT